MADLVAAPVELAVVEFPGHRFNSEVVPAIAEFVDSDTITILDLVLVSRLTDGSVASIEFSELPPDDAAALDQLDGRPTGLLSEDDIERVAGTLSLGSSAALVVWENTWAGRLIDAVAAAGAQVVAHDRLDSETGPAGPPAMWAGWLGRGPRSAR